MGLFSTLQELNLGPKNYESRSPAWEEFPVERVMATQGISNADRVAILGGNAARLLNLKPS